MSTAVQVSMVDRLRKLADVMEENQLGLTYTHFSPDGSVAIYDSDFKKMFFGLPVQGKRRGVMVDVVGELHGINFKASLHLPLPEQQLEVDETITIGA